MERVYERVPGAHPSTSPTPRLLQALDEEGSAREVMSQGMRGRGVGAAWRHAFDLAPMERWWSKDFTDTPLDDLDFLADMIFVGGRRVVTDTEARPLRSVLQELPKKKP